MVPHALRGIQNVEKFARVREDVPQSGGVDDLLNGFCKTLVQLTNTCRSLRPYEASLLYDELKESPYGEGTERVGAVTQSRLSW